MDLDKLRRRLDHWRDRLSRLRIDGEHPTEAAIRAVAEELIEDIDDRLADIEAAERWIPTSERLPDARCEVWIYIPEYRQAVWAQYSPQHWGGQRFFGCRFGRFGADKATYWKPFREPAPPKEGE